MTIGQHNSFLYKSELSFASAVIEHEQEKGTVMKKNLHNFLSCVIIFL